MTDLTTNYLSRCDRPTALNMPTVPIAGDADAPNGGTYTFSKNCAKVLLYQQISETNVAQTARQGVDAGGTGQPASSRIQHSLSRQKSRASSAQFPGWSAGLRNGEADMADGAGTNGKNAGNYRIGVGHQQGGTVSQHSLSSRSEAGAAKAAHATGTADSGPSDPVGARNGDDPAVSGELVSRDLHRIEHAGVQLSFWPSDFHHRGGAQFGQGQRITARHSGIGWAPLPQHNRTIYSGGPHRSKAAREFDLIDPVARPVIGDSKSADDAWFFDNLKAQNLDVSDKISRILFGDLEGLAKAIRQDRRADGQTQGWVPVRGLQLFYELIHTPLLPQDPWSSYDPSNELRTVGVCTQKSLLKYLLKLSGMPLPKKYNRKQYLSAGR